MKKIFTTIALFGLLAGGCSKTENISENNPNSPESGAEKASGYISITIATPSSGNTRADNDEYTEGGGTYEDGTEAESRVEKIRFYFFDDKKNAVPVKKNPDATYLQGKDVYDTFIDYDVLAVDEGDEDHSETVEKTINVTLTLNLPKNGTKPSYVIAVLNPTSSALVNDNYDASNAKTIEKDFAGIVSADYEYLPTIQNKMNFIMSNSVYAENTGTTADVKMEKINYAKVNVCETMEEAKKPEKITTIYVERVAARLDLAITTGANLVPAKSYDGKGTDGIVNPNNKYAKDDATNVYWTGKFHKLYKDNTPGDGEPVFVKFLGWTVTSTPTKSYLLKNINPGWDAGLFGKTPVEPWNSTDYYRSFWAINPETPNHQFPSYKTIKGNESFTLGSEYILENAAASADNDSAPLGYESKVIVAAQLVDKNGKAMPIAEYGFKYYELDDLKEWFADQIFLYTSNTKQDSSTKIQATDLTFKTQAAYTKKAGVGVDGGYYSYVVLTKEAAEKDWYLSDEDKTKLTADKVDTYINSHLDGRLLIWDEGKTYYYFEIKHLGAAGKPGQYGVVRNHIYKAYVNKLTGLGTPVLDPEEPIYPEHPDNTGNILAAEIKVLSWRVVSQDYDFSW